jgi:CubicO group peptidase (beta-lactamase class C family)
VASAESALERFSAAVDSEGLGVYGVRIRIGDESVSRRWRSDDRENLYSVSKGVSAIATGIAIDEGLISLDLTVGEVFTGVPLGEGVSDATLRDFLTMSSGIDFRWFGHEPVV